MKFFDAHTHVQFAAFDKDRKEVIERAIKNGVSIINVGTQADTSAAAIKLANEYAEGLPAEALAKAGIYASVGLHPIHTEKSYHDKKELGNGDSAKAFNSRGEDFDYDYYKKLAFDPKVVAIGECGLDYYRLSEETPSTDSTSSLQAGSGQAKEKQKKVFIKQIELAKDVKKPLMIHCRSSVPKRTSPQNGAGRNAFQDLIDILVSCRLSLVSPPGVIHFFSGTAGDAKKLLELGFSFTFGGVVTFPPRNRFDKLTAGGNSAGDYDEVIKMIPLDRILSETDAPYVTPAPYRGKRNEPLYVIEVVKKLAEIKDVSTEEMAEKIFENAKRIFKI
ncbi:MAG: TatD family hydrolase [Patescibacteria group bacterium]